MGTQADRRLRRAEAILRSLGEDSKWQWAPQIGQSKSITVKVSRSAIQGKSQAQDQNIDRIEAFFLKDENHADFGGVARPQLKDQLISPDNTIFTFQGVVLAENEISWKLQVERRIERRQGVR